MRGNVGYPCRACLDPKSLKRWPAPRQFEIDSSTLVRQCACGVICSDSDLVAVLASRVTTRPRIVQQGR